MLLKLQSLCNSAFSEHSLAHVVLILLILLISIQFCFTHNSSPYTNLTNNIKFHETTKEYKLHGAHIIRQEAKGPPRLIQSLRKCAHWDLLIPGLVWTALSLHAVVLTNCMLQFMWKTLYMCFTGILCVLYWK